MMRRSPRRKETGLERRVRLALKRAGVYAIENYPMGRVQPDFWLPQWKVVIEVDGAPWHHTVHQLARDRRKDQIYASMGYRVFRMPQVDVMKSADACVDRMLALLGKHRERQGA